MPFSWTNQLFICPDVFSDDKYTSVEGRQLSLQTEKMAKWEQRRSFFFVGKPLTNSSHTENIISERFTAQRPGRLRGVSKEYINGIQKNVTCTEKKKYIYIYFAVGRATGRVVGSIPGLVRSYVVRFSTLAPFLFFLQSRVSTPDFTSPAHRTLSGAVQSCFLLFSHSRWIPSTHHGASAANSPSGTRTR